MAGWCRRAAFTNLLGIAEVSQRNGRRLVRCGGTVRTRRRSTMSPIVQVERAHRGRRFAPCGSVAGDATIPQLFGIEAEVRDDTVRRFFGSVDPVLSVERIAWRATRSWGALPWPTILARDSTVQPRHGLPQSSRRGYNPVEPVRHSFHPRLAVVARMRLCRTYPFRSVKSATATQWAQTMVEAQRWFGDHPVWRLRGGLGLRATRR